MYDKRIEIFFHDLCTVLYKSLVYERSLIYYTIPENYEYFYRDLCREIWYTIFKNKEIYNYVIQFINHYMDIYGNRHPDYYIYLEEIMESIIIDIWFEELKRKEKILDKIRKYLYRLINIIKLDRCKNECFCDLEEKEKNYVINKLYNSMKMLKKLIYPRI